jgi:molecular chaperone GrpE (heat shock protein)
LDDWKQNIEYRFREWLEQLEEDDLPVQPEAEGAALDLASFYEALCALEGDVRKSSRRSHETFTRFGDTLAGFEGLLQDLAGRLSEERRQRENLEQSARKRFLTPFAEMLDRLRRMEEKIIAPPSGWVVTRRRWNEAWSGFHEGFALLCDHFEMLLEAADVTRMQTTGRPFDPAAMKAVMVTESDTHPPNTVIEELAAGYYHKDQVLKFAEVNIAVKRKEP